MKLKVLKNGTENNLKFPAKEGDVGYDLVAASIKIVGVKTEDSEEKCDLGSYWHEIHHIEYDTGIALEPYHFNSYFGPEMKINYPERTDFTKYVQVAPRSSISNYNLVLANCVATIDPNFRGTIKCRFKYIFQPNDLQFNGNGIIGRIDPKRVYGIGDKVAQAIFANVIHPEVTYVDKLSDSSRQGGEFGSTGK